MLDGGTLLNKIYVIIKKVKSTRLDIKFSTKLHKKENSAGALQVYRVREQCSVPLPHDGDDVGGVPQTEFDRFSLKKQNNTNNRLSIRNKSAPIVPNGCSNVREPARKG